MFVTIAEMVLAELPRDVPLSLQQFRDRHIPCLQTFLSARQSNLEQSSTETRLTGDEAGTSGGTALLTIPVREQRAFLCDAVNIRRLVTHHALVVSADVPIADIVAPDDEDVGFLLLRRSGRSNEHQRTGERGRDRNALCFHSLVMF